MINRLLVLAVLLVFTPFAYTDPDAAVLQSEADHALAEGDIETALGKHSSSGTGCKPRERTGNG